VTSRERKPLSVRKLLTAGYRVHLPVRQGNPLRYQETDLVSVQVLSEFDEASLRTAVANSDTVIYNIGIIREHPAQGITYRTLHQELPQMIIDLSIESGVERFILMSANGVEQQLTGYQRTKLAAEKYLQQSHLQWTIIRPSVIFGDPGNHQEFTTDLVRRIIQKPLPAPSFFSVIGKQPDTLKMSPVHAADVARIITCILPLHRYHNRILSLGGDRICHWNAILKEIGTVLKHRKLRLPVPIELLQLLAELLDWLPGFPITRDQLRMLKAGNVCDSRDLFQDLELDPIPFTATNLDYLKSYLVRR